MPISLTLKEKCYLVALGGDIPEARRADLYLNSSCPTHAGPVILTEGYRFIERMNEGKFVVVKPKD